MLKITIHDGAGQLRLCLEGRLSGPWVEELRQCWLTAASTTFGRETVLDLRDVDFIDGAGQVLLAEMGRSNVNLVVSTPLIQELVKDLTVAPGCVRFEGKPARSRNAIFRTLSTRSNAGAI